MQFVARARLVLARRPWIYWMIVAVLTVATALGVQSRLAAVDARRDAWGTSLDVLVATRDLSPGDDLHVETVALPAPAIPEGALSSLPTDARLRQRVGAGEVLVDHDITARPGPAARADPGTVVVAIRDPTGARAAIGLAVQVAADGMLIADRGTVVDLADDVVFVAVDPRDGPAVAAAARADLATLLYLP